MFYVRYLIKQVGDITEKDFGGYDSEYNYINAATEAGYSTLSYDRIGTGKSTKADSHLRNGSLSEFASISIPNPSKVVQVGHSFGSALVNALAETEPSLSDVIVLTGYSSNTTWTVSFAIASNFPIAAETDPQRFGEYDKGSLTWADELANQYAFFRYPYFDPDVLAAAERNKMPAAIGEILILEPTDSPAWTGPVLLISADQDHVLCGGKCHGILSQAKQLFPNAETYVQPNMGHFMNLHFNATAFYGVVNDFVGGNVVL
ncbi:hypothetical protein LTR37_007197 [Vermiconidia calcicola]|uniref:Uncharacterized protein n=1 Tax=Vermiconidia calcicola TaxID=1690605 RepID=A0ACC3NDU9_9PEZI|nr:hypothetical protein LTR37_007197 [Vermiconidia calcicola]